MRVILVRHGQASLHGETYDQLSPQGYEQSRVLGRTLRQQPWHPSLVCVGPRHRHRQTWETIVHEGNTWPDASFHESLDELPAEEVLPLSLPILMQRDGEVGAAAQTLIQQFGKGTPPMEHLLTVIDAGLGLWMAGEVTHASVESWDAFKRRVLETLSGLATHAQPNAPALAVTSAGFIATALGLIQGQSPSEIRRNILQIPNASYTILEMEATGSVWRVVDEPTDAFLEESLRTQI